jgi:hypothetical protein
MERKIDDRNILDKFSEDFCAIVEEHVKYMIVSGFAAISSGRTRGTEDIDMIIDKISEKDFVALHEDLVKNGFECIQSSDSKEIFNSYLLRLDSIRYTWKDKFLPEMEIHFVRDVIDEYQLKKRTKMPLTGLNIFFAPLEGNIAYKEEWLKSDKDLADAKHLRVVYSESINLAEIETIK